jgi:hypothetical protein
MKLLLTTSLLLLTASAAHAQEPRTAIKPADPISAPSHDVTIMSGDGEKPVIQPTPLPKLKIDLAEVARRVRAARVALPKARTVVNDDQPIETAFREIF